MIRSERELGGLCRGHYLHASPFDPGNRLCRAHHPTTKLTSFPGTTTTLRTVLPSSRTAIFGSSRASRPWSRPPRPDPRDDRRSGDRPQADRHESRRLPALPVKHDESAARLVTGFHLVGDTLQLSGDGVSPAFVPFRVSFESLASSPGVNVASCGGGSSSFVPGRDLGHRGTCPAPSGRGSSLECGPDPPAFASCDAGGCHAPRHWRSTRASDPPGMSREYR